MHSDSIQLRRTLLCLIGINAVLYGYRSNIAPSTTAVTPYEFSVTPYECQMYHYDMFAISFLSTSVPGMHSDSKQFRRTLLCLIDINAVLNGYHSDIAPSTASETPQQRYGNMVLP